ncbi:thiamine pyrophosphate-requiring protein [Lentzea jiangxiensis]|uniref:Pyruvate dehydrogenase (Quinone) n=1 Tax=Lentzea jiangxiensis TaxID=641025 RepID=A0A1H0FEQ3_9PSEU|nr:thiamine pyrophosphate-requiring protein [Lentzea jiangxiensis]SDN92839.1 pyruvate dehydrogenase (quinone) [Lentzea jiangxiensis]
MTTTVGDFVVQRLRDWGVAQVFAYPGDGINGIVAAFGKADDDPKFVQTRHEEMAALAAVGFAKFSDQVGVCLATSGPGAIHLLNGLYDAKLDHVPVVAIVGQTARTAQGGSFQQEVDLHSLFRDVASFLVDVTVPEQLPNALDRAMRTARADRAPAVVIIPNDVQEQEYAAPEHEFKHIPSSPPSRPSSVVTPAQDEVERAAEVLNSGEKVAVLVGQGARGAADEVRATADLLGAGIAKALLGKDVLPDDLPYVTGSIGLLGTRPSYEMMRDCDRLLIIGSNFPYSQYLPKPGAARGVQIDLDGRAIGMRHPTEVTLVGDAKATLRALIPLLRRKEDRSWRTKIEADVERWWEVVERQAQVPADPVNPMRIVSELSRRLPHNAIVTADSGSATNWYARLLRVRGNVRSSLSGTLATMGCAVPYALGAAFAQPNRPLIALVGDGAMQMNGMAELLTLRRYGIRCVVCVFHNNDLNQVTWELRAMGGAPKFEQSQSLPDVSYASYARSIGLQGIEVDDPEQLGAAWETALAFEGSTVLDVRCDPDVPPIPPHATFDQIKDMTEAVLRGDPDAWGVLRRGLHTKIQELLP